MALTETGGRFSCLPFLLLHYDNLSRIVEEKHLAENTKICYTYDSLSRVTNRTIRNECDDVISSENYSYDAAGNITDAPNSCFGYDTNNRLISHNGYNISYDMDGNMLNNGCFKYDSANRLIETGDLKYTYNAEDVRIRSFGEYVDTAYTYNTNCKLSQLLTKTTNGITTKYVYGLGLIGEEKESCFKTYHFDYRGSTVAITDECGNIIDTLKYDTYGNVTEHIGDSYVIFGYNGRDGVITDRNGLLYMRARYYSPAIRRFINADILHGEISDSTSLNRYSYVNGNPVSYVDPFGLSKERGSSSQATLDFSKAVLVSNFNYMFPINITGHTQLYFWDRNNNQWYMTEFDGDSKANAKVTINPVVAPPVYDAAGINRVVLEGDFNASYALACYYAKNQNFGRYNFLFHNCSDYTNKLLDVADLDGMSSQILSEGNSLISIPVLREFQLSVAKQKDLVTNWISDSLISAGNSISGSGLIGDFIGDTLAGTGKFIKKASDFVGDAVDVVKGINGKVVDGAKYVASTVTNGIVDFATAVKKKTVSLWNKWF